MSPSYSSSRDGNSALQLSVKQERYPCQVAPGFVISCILWILSCCFVLPSSALPFQFRGHGGNNRVHASQVVDVHLGELSISWNSPNFTLSPVVLEPGSSLFFSVSAPASRKIPCAYLIELLYDPLLRREDRPDPLLLAQLKKEPNPFSTSTRLSISESSEPADIEQIPETPQARINNSMPISSSSIASDNCEHGKCNVTARATTSTVGIARAFSSPSTKLANSSLQVNGEGSAGEIHESNSRTPCHDLNMGVRNVRTENFYRVSRPRYLSDAEAFVTWRPYSYIVLRMVHPGQSWHIRVLNHNGTTMNTLTATLRVSMETPPVSWTEHGHAKSSQASDFESRDSQQQERFLPGKGHSLCPRGHPMPLVGKGPKKTLVCSGQGDCRRGRCICNENYRGRYCEALVRDLPRQTFSVPIERMLYFRYKVPTSGAVAAVMHIAPSAEREGLQLTHPILFAKRLGENGGVLLQEGPPLPSTYDTMFSDRISFRALLPTQVIVRRYVSKGDVLYLGVYNYRRSTLGWTLGAHSSRSQRSTHFHRPAKVRIEVYPCEPSQRDSSRISDEVGYRRFFRYLFAGRFVASRRTRRKELESNSKPGADIVVMPAQERPLCPVSAMAMPVDLGSAYLMLPIMLGICSLVTAVVCVMTWARIFRHCLRRFVRSEASLHESNDEEIDWCGRVDRLSCVEINAMFPAFTFSKAQGVALSVAGDPSCSVCLCSYETNELLRRLRCGHSYHAACLDAWLRRNATCPRCRTSARIADAASSRSIASWCRYLCRMTYPAIVLRTRTSAL